jgi:cytochrome P450
MELARLIGEGGVLVTEGHHHRTQRKMMNPAFGPGQIRELTGIFIDKANEV